MGCDLILAVDFRSDGAGGFWAHGRRWAAAGDPVLRWRGLQLAGDGDRGVAGPYLGRGLAQEHRSGMGSALGCLGRRCRAGSMALDGEAALGGASCRNAWLGSLGCVASEAI